MVAINIYKKQHLHNYSYSKVLIILKYPATCMCSYILCIRMNWAIVTPFIAVKTEKMIFIMCQAHKVVTGIFNHLLVLATTAITLHNIYNKSITTYATSYNCM